MDGKRNHSDYAVIMERTDLMCYDCMNGLPFPIHRAATIGHVECMKQIFYNLQNTYILLDSNNNTPLHAAASAGQIESLKFLLNFTRVSVHHQNAQGETCVHTSALHHRLDSLKILLDESIKKVNSLIYQKDNLGCTVLHCAILVNDNDIALWLLQRFGKNLANMANEENVLPLHLAAAEGNIEFIRIATKYDAQMVNKRDKNGATAAFYAAQSGCLLCLKYLIDKAKSDIRILTKRGQSLVHAACLNGHEEIVRWLFTKFDKSVICQQTSDASSPFHCAAYAGHKSVLKLLHKINGREKILVIITDRRGNTALHLAAMKGHVDCADYLLKLGADPEVRNKLGQTPIYIAEKRNHATLSRLFQASVDGSQINNEIKRANGKIAQKDPIKLVRPHSMSTSGYSSTAVTSEHYEVANAPFNRRRRIQESSGYTSSSSEARKSKKIFQKSVGVSWKGKPVLIHEPNECTTVLADDNWMLKKKDIQDLSGFTDEQTLRIVNSHMKLLNGTKNDIVDSQIQTDFDPLVDNIIIVDDDERIIFSSIASMGSIFKPITREKTPVSTNSLESCFSVDDRKQVKRRPKRTRESSIRGRKSFDKSSSESDIRSAVRNDETSVISLSSSNNTESSENSCAFVFENPTERSVINRMEAVIRRGLQSDTEESGIFYETPNSSKTVAAVVHQCIEKVTVTNGIHKSTNVQEHGCFMVAQRYTSPASEISLPITSSPVQTMADIEDIGRPLSLPLLHDDINLKHNSDDLEQIEEKMSANEVERRSSLRSVSVKSASLTDLTGQALNLINNALIDDTNCNAEIATTVATPFIEEVATIQNSDPWKPQVRQVIMSNPDPPPFRLMEMRRCIKNEQKALVVKRIYSPMSRALSSEERELCRNKVSEIKKRLEEHFGGAKIRLPPSNNAQNASESSENKMPIFTEYKHKLCNNVVGNRDNSLNAKSFRYFGTSNGSDSDLRTNSQD